MCCIVKHNLAVTDVSAFIAGYRRICFTDLWSLSTLGDLEDIGCQALPNKERNLFIRNQKILCSIQGNKFKWIVLNLGHQEKEKSPPRKSLTTPIMQVTLHII